MEKFSTFFGLKLSHLFFSGTEQLSLSLQGKDTTVQEATVAAEMAIQYLTRLRSDESYDQFYSNVIDGSKELTAPPALPRFRRPPRRPGDDSAASHEFVTPASYFRKQYFEVLDLLTSELKRRFQQKRGLPVVAVIEKVLLNAANGVSNSGELPDELQLYQTDVDLPRLKIQLQMIPGLIRTRNTLSVYKSAPTKAVTNVRTM